MLFSDGETNIALFEFFPVSCVDNNWLCKSLMETH